MLVYGAMFCCLDPVLTIAAALSYRSPFVAPFDKRDQADEAKRSFAVQGERSDHLTLWNAYREWNEQPSQGLQPGRPRQQPEAARQGRGCSQRCAVPCSAE